MDDILEILKAQIESEDGWESDNILTLLERSIAEIERLRVQVEEAEQRWLEECMNNPNSGNL